MSVGVALRYLVPGLVLSWYALPCLACMIAGIDRGEYFDGEYYDYWMETLVGAHSGVALTMIGTLFLLGRGEWIMGKNERGFMPLWSMMLWWPFHFLNQAMIFLKRKVLKPNVPDANAILDDLFLGGWQCDNVLKRVMQKRFEDGGMLKTKPMLPAVIDLTVELPERILPGERSAYLWLPVWDGNSPNVAQLDTAVAFAKKHMSKGSPVVIHCAHGVGRSTTAMCAVLIESGKARTVDEALAIVRKSRPIARLNSLMKSSLQNWLASRQRKQK